MLQSKLQILNINTKIFIYINNNRLTLDPTVRMSVLSVFVGGTFFKLQNTSINQPTIQRFVALSSMKKIKMALITFSIGLMLLLSCCIYVGLLTYATYYDCDPVSTGVSYSLRLSIIFFLIYLSFHFSWLLSVINWCLYWS